MLGGTGIRRSGAVAGLVRQRLTATPTTSRSISTFGAHRPGIPIRYGRTSQLLAGESSWRATPSMSKLMSARFNSTSSTGSAASATTAATASEQGSGVASEPVLPDVADAATPDINAIPEGIGYLKDLGLDYGFGPTSLVEYILEHLHIWAGLPWWASIVATGLLIRLALLKPSFMAADTATKMRNTQHLTAPLRQKMLDSYHANDTAATAKLQLELKEIYHMHDLKPSRAALPMLNIPLGFGCFRLFEGMAHLPVPTLATESVGWLKDLTVADPYFILPLLSSGFLYLNLRKGGETSSNELLQSGLGKGITMMLPVVSLGFMSFFPAALQIYFTTTSLIGLSQAYLLSSTRFRMFARIDIPNPVLPNTAAEETVKKIKTLKQFADEQRSKELADAAQRQEKRISLLDRAMNRAKSSGANVKQGASDWWNKAKGTPSGPPPRLSEQERKMARDYEKQRAQEEDYKREEMNHLRRQAYLKTLEKQKEKMGQSKQDTQEARPKARVRKDQK